MPSTTFKPCMEIQSDAYLPENKTDNLNPYCTKKDVYTKLVSGKPFNDHSAIAKHRLLIKGR